LHANWGGHTAAPSSCFNLPNVLFYTSYAVRIQTGRFHPMNVRFACGSMVLLFVFFTQMLHKV